MTNTQKAIVLKSNLNMKIIFLFLISFMIKSNYAESSQRIFKQMVFSATSWPNLVYKMAPIKVTKAFDCVGQCQLESSVCNICFFDSATQQCWLATFGANNVMLGAQSQAMAGYADLGKTMLLYKQSLKTVLCCIF